MFDDRSMAYFTTNKLLELAARRSVRTEYVRAGQRALDNIYAIEHIVRPALPLAREEQRDFRDTFGEPMPHHLRYALEAEITLWERLHQGLTTLRERTATDQLIDDYTRRVRSYLACQRDLLTMEEEMLTSCLVQHYEEQRDAILTAAAAIDITRV